MPAWVRKVFIQKLPRLLLMRVPIQVIKDRTNETLAMLAKLDSLATVSSARIVQHNFSKKRQKKIHDEDEKTEDAASSLLFSEEEIDRLSKEYFLHSKAEKPKQDTWKD